MSNDAKSVSVQVGPGGMTVLTIAFVLLKVYNKIDWSWWWVFSPLWIPTVVILGILGVIAVIALIAAIID